jgi:hypothetical protein
MPRKPAVAGRFYPGNASNLRSAIHQYTPQIMNPQNALGALSPHAGYAFSGPTAGAVFGRIKVPKTVVLLCPSHSYRQPACALWTDGPWRTPLGDAEIHQDLCEGLEQISAVTADDRPHVPEHSGEVVVPFLQYHRPDVKLCVLCLTASADMATARELGEGINAALDQAGEEDALVVASSDMSHERGSKAKKVVDEHDPLAIEKMKALDAPGLVQVCRENRITMCGVFPAAAMMFSVRGRGGNQGELIDRATSADAPQGGGDYVVGYAGMIFS